MDNRRHNRVNIDVPIIVQGTDLQGKEFEEETFTLNISASGAYFVSTHEYNKLKIVTVTIHLIYPLGDIVKPGDYTSKAKIIRLDHVVKAEDGKLKKQNVAIQFMGILGVNTSRDVWADVRD